MVQNIITLLCSTITTRDEYDRGDFYDFTIF